MADPKITLVPIPSREEGGKVKSGGALRFRVDLYHLSSRASVAVELHEAGFGPQGVEETKDAFGVIRGAAVANGKGDGGARYAVDVTANEKGTKADPKKRQIEIEVRGAAPLVFDLPRQPKEAEGDNFFLFAKLVKDGKEFRSNQIPLAIVPEALPVAEQATYDWHAYNELMLFHAGNQKTPPHEKSAFAEMVQAIKGAERLVLVADWSFHPYFRVERDPPGKDALLNGEGTIGKLLIDAVKSQSKLLVAIHTWKHIPHAADDAQNNDAWQRFLDLAGGKEPTGWGERFFWRASGRTITYTHHQKFVVVDVPSKRFGQKRELRAFFGGLDLTKGRWDDCDHVIDPYPTDQSKAAVLDLKRKLHYDISAAELEKLKRQGKKLDPSKKPFYDDWYNAEFQADAAADLGLPRQPWHDIHASVTGPAAWDVVREFVGRWNNDADNDGIGHTATKAIDGGDTVVYVPNTAVLNPVNDMFVKLLNDKALAQQWEKPEKLDESEEHKIWSGQVYRSIERKHWEMKAPIKGRPHEMQWTLPGKFEKSIQHAYRQAIQKAKKYIYIETQYFISSSKHWGDVKDGNQVSGVDNDLAKLIVDRILENPKLHCFVVAPMYPEGDPVGGAGVAKTIRYYEWRTMEYMIGRLYREFGLCWQDHLSFYFPVKCAGARAGRAVTYGADRVHLKAKAKHGEGEDTAPEYVAMPKDKAPFFGYNAPDRKAAVYLNNRHMVYVHSKLMMVDDRYVILGSANLNERSLNGGRDTEICIGFWPTYSKFIEKCEKQLKDFRHHLFGEHFGGVESGDDFAKFAGDVAVKNATRNYVDFRLAKPLSKGQCCTLPFWWSDSEKTLGLTTPDGVDKEDNLFVPDPDLGLDPWTDPWTWHSTWGALGKPADLPE